MKIAVVSSGHIPSQYAHSINTIKHANALQKMGHEVEVLCVQRFYEEKLLNEIGSLDQWYGVESLKYKFFKDNKIFFYKEVGLIGKIIRVFNKLTGGFFKNFHDPEKRISNYIKENDFDLSFGRSYRVINNNIDNSIPTIIETHSAQPHKVKEIREFLVNSQSKYFLGIVTIHEKLKENFLHLDVPENKIVVCEDAVELESFNTVSDNKAQNRVLLNLPKDKKIILYSGSLKQGKGIHIILEIAQKFKDNKEVLFVLVGGSKNEVAYWKSYNGYVLKNVLFKGFTKGDLIPTYLKSADILLMPYDLDDKNMVMDINTTSPIKLFEYMASKVPIVSTKIDVIQKVLEHNKSILLAEKFDDYIFYINELFDEKKANKISMNAYNEATRYTYQTRCQTIIKKLYNKSL